MKPISPEDRLAFRAEIQDAKRKQELLGLMPVVTVQCDAALALLDAIDQSERDIAVMIHAVDEAHSVNIAQRGALEAARQELAMRAETDGIREQQIADGTKLRDDKRGIREIAWDAGFEAGRAAESGELRHPERAATGEIYAENPYRKPKP